MPGKSSQNTEARGVKCWRVTSTTKRNIDIALKAKQWGGSTPRFLRMLRPGDRLAFYVSAGRSAGYWSTATVASGISTSNTRLWPDDDYPYRIGLKSQSLPRGTAVPREEVQAALASGRLMYLRRTAIMPLTKEEFGIISRLIDAD